MTEQESFKEVESLCGVARLAILEAFAHTKAIPEGELRQDAIKTLEDTLLDILGVYRGETIVTRPGAGAEVN